jgi:hypothetical protein
MNNKNLIFKYSVEMNFSAEDFGMKRRFGLDSMYILWICSNFYVLQIINVCVLVPSKNWKLHYN